MILIFSGKSSLFRGTTCTSETNGTKKHGLEQVEQLKKVGSQELAVGSEEQD
jgi:hypothetical protein